MSSLLVYIVLFAFLTLSTFTFITLWDNWNATPICFLTSVMSFFYVLAHKLITTYLFVNWYYDLGPLVHGSGWGDLSIWDIWGDEAQQSFLQNFWPIVYIILLRCQLSQVLLLRSTQKMHAYKKFTNNVYSAVRLYLRLLLDHSGTPRTWLHGWSAGR